MHPWAVVIAAIYAHAVAAIGPPSICPSRSPSARKLLLMPQNLANAGLLEVGPVTKRGLDSTGAIPA